MGDTFKLCCSHQRTRTNNSDLTSTITAASFIGSISSGCSVCGFLEAWKQTLGATQQPQLQQP
jgi:hypothetical protein